MLTEARIEEDLRPQERLDWITALRAPQIRTLVRAGVVQLSFFDQQDLAEVRGHPDYPGERLIVCRNPLLAAERQRKREELLAVAEKKWREMEAATRRTRRPLRSAEKIRCLVGKAPAASKAEKYFRWEIRSEALWRERNGGRIQQHASLDGIYVLRTSVSNQFLDTEQNVLAYKRLAAVARAFRSLKSVDLNVRPIYRRVPDRVRAHVFGVMLAYYVEWHMRQAVGPVLFDDEQRGDSRCSPVTPARRSPEASAKARSQRTADGWPVQSFQGRLKDVAAIAKNLIEPRLPSLPAFEDLTQNGLMRGFPLPGETATQRDRRRRTSRTAWRKGGRPGSSSAFGAASCSNLRMAKWAMSSAPPTPASCCAAQSAPHRCVFDSSTAFSISQRS